MNDEYCLVCAAKGHLVEAIMPRHVVCVVTGAHPAICPQCNKARALVPLEVAEATRKAFLDASGSAGLMK